MRVETLLPLGKVDPGLREPGTPFDVKTGRLVTRYRCTRCGATRTEAR